MVRWRMGLCLLLLRFIWYHLVHSMDVDDPLDASESSHDQRQREEIHLQKHDTKEGHRHSMEGDLLVEACIRSDHWKRRQRLGLVHDPHLSPFVSHGHHEVQRANYG